MSAREQQLDAYDTRPRPAARGLVGTLAQWLIDRLWFLAHPRAAAAVKRRNFSAAATDRLQASFLGTSRAGNVDLRHGLRRMRYRSRDLCINNDYARRFLRMCANNVIGWQGVRLLPMPRRADGKVDRPDQAAIRRAWRRWGRVGTCTVTKRQSWRDVQRLIATTLPRDGEVLIRLHRGPVNEFGFALQVLECDLLDEDYNIEQLSNGNRIIMSVEVDENLAPVAYHLRTRHPGDTPHGAGQVYAPRERVPAEEIIHVFIEDRPGDVRGAPWMFTSIRRLNMLGGFEEAELVASRVSASKMGFFEREDDAPPLPNDPHAQPMADRVEGEGASAQPVTEANPGTFESLAPGVKFTPWDPQHPNTAFKDFVKSILRGVASGLNVSYHTLSNDLEGVNYSSIRTGVIEERDAWRMIQAFIIEHVCEIVFERWLESALERPVLPLPITQLAKFLEAVWLPRGWDWVDPDRDSKAAERHVRMGTMSKAEIAARRGVDLEEVFEQLAIEQELAAQYELTLEPEASLEDDPAATAATEAGAEAGAAAATEALEEAA